MDHHSLFRTTRALRWVNMWFVRMLGRPQEGNEVVLVMGLWIDLVSCLPVGVDPMIIVILQAVLLVLMSKMQLRGACQLTSRSRQHRRLQLSAVLIAYLIIYAFYLRKDRAAENLGSYPTVNLEGEVHYNEYYSTPAFDVACLSAEILTQVVAVLLLIFRPPIIASLTNSPLGRRLVSLAKLISAVALAFGSAVAVWPPAFAVGHSVVNPSYFIIGFTVAALSLGSLQTPAANSNLSGRRWIDVIMHILFLWYLPITMQASVFGDYQGTRRFTALAAGLSSILFVAVLLMENLQIPDAAIQVLLSSSRFHRLNSDYHPPPPPEKGFSSNMVPAIKVFYVLALCQGSLYIMASVLGLLSFFPRRSLVRQSKFSGQRGAKAIDVYYECSYATCMDTGLFAARKTLSLASFAAESLSSSSSEVRLAAVLVLDNRLHERETVSSEELRSRIVSSNKTLSTLIGMLGWADGRHRDVRLIAARAIANLADSLTVAEIPSTLRLVSSLLDADNQPAKDEPGRLDSSSEAACSVNGQRDHQETSAQTVPGNNGGNAACSNQHTGEHLEHGQCNNAGVFIWVWRCWQRMKEKWSVLEEPSLTHQDSLQILGMVILERLAHVPDNCAEIVKARYLISKIIGLISYTADNESSSNEQQQHAVLFSSLNFVRRLAITGESIGAALLQELCNNSFLLNSLECVLEDNCMSPELMKLAIEILTKLAFDEDARKEIGGPKVLIGKLMHAFLGKDGATNKHYDQSLRMAAGEALANLTIESPANCLSILEEPWYELVKDLKNMISEDEYRYVAACLLQNVCAHSGDKLRHQGAGDYLSSAIPMLMENIMSAGGKQLEPLIGLISQISYVIPEPFVRELQLQTNGPVLVQKLVGTLNSNRRPNPEYPKMRRVIVEMLISIVKFCPRYATIYREGGMLEALTKVERTPSKVEKYRVFYGNLGVVPESGSSLTDVVATAKVLIHSAAPTLGA